VSDIIHSSAEKIGFVTLVSGQTAPVANGVLWAKEHYAAKGYSSLDKVILLHTSSEVESVGPATRIKEYGFLLADDIVLELTGQLPDEVYGVLSQLPIRYPDITRWVLNATGGLKNMTLGVANLLLAQRLRSTTSVWDIFYREIGDGKWYQWRLSEEGLLEAVAQNEYTIQTLPPRVLAAMQYKHDAMEYAMSPSADTISISTASAELVPLTQELIRSQWKWQRVFAQYNLPSDTGSGTAFEIYIGAIVANLLDSECFDWSFKLHGRNDGKEIMEIDFVANSGGKLCLFETKLKTRELLAASGGIGAMIHRYGAIQRELGGLGARTLILLPNVKLNPEEREVARAYKITCLDEATAAAYPTEIAKFLLGKDAELPAVLCQIQEALENTTQAPFDSDGRPKWMSPIPSSNHGTTSSFYKTFLNDSSSVFEDQEGEQDWVLYRIGQELFLLLYDYHKTEGQAAGEKERQARQIIKFAGSGGKFPPFWFSPGGKIAVCGHWHQKNLPLEMKLRSFIGKPLLEGGK
jgi:hypothetical protein